MKLQTVVLIHRADAMCARMNPGLAAVAIALGVATVAMAAISLSASLPQAAAGETPVLPPWDLATSPGAIAW
jgi:hypothetical protein